VSALRMVSANVFRVPIKHGRGGENDVSHCVHRVHPVVVSVAGGCDNVRPHPPVPLFCWRVRARSAKSPPHRRNWCDRANLANDHHHRSEPVFKPRRTPSFFADTFRFNV
jgi:hypothetical protein